MVFFKKKKNKEEKAPAQPVKRGESTGTAPQADSDDPLGLVHAEAHEAPGPKDMEGQRSGHKSADDDGAGIGDVPPRRRPASGVREQVEPKTVAGLAEDPREQKQNLQVMTNAAKFLTGIALDTRGLFEEVRPIEEAEAVRKFFLDSAHVPQSALLSGAFDPHAAASLIVFQLRDSEEPLMTAALREDILNAASLDDDAARFEALRDTIQLLPAANRALLSALVELGVAVSHEHAACYQDGLHTRMEGLAQLLGPLLTRPAPASFEADMAAAVAFGADLLKSPSLLSPPLRVPSSDSEPPAPSQPPTQPTVPSLSLPTRTASSARPPQTNPTPRAVTFRAEEAPAAAAVDEGEDSDETNYNAARGKAEEHAAFAVQVASLSDAARKEYLHLALRGGPLLKYSSRGREAALHMFRVSDDLALLQWAHAATPTDLKYGFPLESALQVCPGRLADGSFHGAGSDSRPELRLVLRLVGGLQLELEALNRPALDAWAIALQHIVAARSTLPAALPFDLPPGAEPFMPFTHRDRALPPGAGPEAGRAGPAGVPPYQVPGARHGDETSRLLDNAVNPTVHANSHGNAPRARPSTARPTREPPAGAGGPRGPMTARGPREQEEEPDVTAINVQVMISKARHNRHKELVPLLDRGLDIDSTDQHGNTVLIVGCQNGHKRIVKEALRRYCNMDHQNKRGNTGVHFCFAYKYDELGRYLVSKGADDTLRNNRGKTCYEVLDGAEMNDYADDPPPDDEEVGGGGGAAGGKAEEAEEVVRMREKVRELEKENSLLKTQHGGAPSAEPATIPALPPAAKHPAQPSPPEPPKRGPPAAPKPVAGVAEAEALEALGLVVSPPQMETASTVQIGGRFERYSADSAARVFGGGVGLFKPVVEARPLEESGVMCEPKLTNDALRKACEQHPPPQTGPPRAPSVASTARSIGGLEGVLQEVKRELEQAEDAAAHVLTPFGVDESGVSEAEGPPLTGEALQRVAAQHPAPESKYRAPSEASTAPSIGGLRGVLDEVKQDVGAVEDVRWSVVGQMVDAVKHDVQDAELAMAHVTTPFAVDGDPLPDDVSVSSSILQPAVGPPSPTADSVDLNISIFARSPCPPLMTPPLDASVSSPAKDGAADSNGPEPVTAARDLVARLGGKDSAEGARHGRGQGGAAERREKLASIFGNLSGRGKYNPASAVGKAGDRVGLPPTGKLAASPAPKAKQGRGEGGFSNLEEPGGGRGLDGGAREEALVGVLSGTSSDDEEAGPHNESLEGLEAGGHEAPRTADGLSLDGVRVGPDDAKADRQSAAGAAVPLGGNGHGGADEEAAPVPPARVKRGPRGESSERGAGRSMRVKAGTGAASRKMPIVSLRRG